jgi:hypothetical protein
MQCCRQSSSIIRFKGELTVERDKDRFPEWPGCQKVASDRTVLGCSVRARNRDGTIDKSRCDVYVAPDYVLQRSGTNYEDVLRHEIGHCNGWAGNHAGGPERRTAHDASGSRGGTGDEWHLAVGDTG